jgi:DNA-binding GntR family transcriptional regulator
MVVYSRHSDIRTVERVTLADRAFDQIVEAIEQGRIAPRIAGCSNHWQAYKEHQEILTGLRRRDADAAEGAMRKHVRLSWSNTQTRLKAGGSFPKDAAS